MVKAHGIRKSNELVHSGVSATWFKGLFSTESISIALALLFEDEMWN